jgi:nicotinate-nucleotide adenylyltransferase
MTRPRIALFGGTFDPVHWGHLLLAESARSAFRLDRVIFVPTGLPPHKAPPVASAADRWRMLRLAIAGNPAFVADDWEIRQKRVVYSYETIDYFRRRWPKSELFFIVGTDMLQILPKWVRGPELMKRTRFLAAERPEYPWSRVPQAARRRAQLIKWPAVPLASHDIRGAVHRGRSIRYQVPAAVEKYIWKHRLYS